jgi:hypothetical protein
MILRINPRTSLEGLRKIYAYVWLNPKGCNDNLLWTYPVSNIIRFIKKYGKWNIKMDEK